MAIPALTLLVPTSVTAASGTATVSATGKVSFVSAQSLSVDGVFTSEYRNYQVMMHMNGGTFDNLRMHLRAGGSNNTASTYHSQLINATGTSETSARVGTQNHFYLWTRDTWGDGWNMIFCSPQANTSTTMHARIALSDSNARLADVSQVHTTNYQADGFMIYSDSHTFTGMLTVYGMAD